MGIFDLFKKKKKDDDQYLKSDLNEENVEKLSHPTSSINDSYSKITKKSIFNSDSIDAPIELFDFIFKYREYVVRYLGMMFQGNNSPIAAYQKTDGEIKGYLFITEDMSYNLSVEQVIEKMEIEFEKRINNNEISSWTIFYHSEFNNNDNHKVANEHSLTRAISVKYKSTGNAASYLGFPYNLNGDDVRYKGFSDFSIEQNRQILSTQLINGKDYFQERVLIEPPIYENKAGIKIKTVNNGGLGNMWKGIFGYERLQKGNQILMQYMALVISRTPVKKTDDVSITEVKYGDVVFRGVSKNDNSIKTVYPFLKTNRFIDTQTKQIAEWENSDNLEAVISGGGRDTFGITYFAADYAENKSIYQANVSLNTALSGIILVLNIDDQQQNALPDGTPIAGNFAMYMPHKDLGEFGCYDFMGILEYFKEQRILEAGLIEGYILKVRLINDDSIEDFFSIPMFVNKSHINGGELKKGMKISGVFQLIGEIIK